LFILLLGHIANYYCAFQAVKTHWKYKIILDYIFDCNNVYCADYTKMRMFLSIINWECDMENLSHLGLLFKNFWRDCKGMCSPSKLPSDLSTFKQYWNALWLLTRQLRNNFERKLADNVNANPKAFWKYLNSCFRN